MANIYATLAAGSDIPSTIVGRANSRVYTELLEHTSELLTANEAADEVTVIATFGGTATGGNYTLTVNAPLYGVSYTTASIAHDAAAATIEAALDTASPATVGDGDINVAAGATDFTDGNMTFTCSGNVAETPVLISITDVDLSGTDPVVGAVTRSTAGQPDRNALQALFDLGLVSGTVPDCGEANTDWVTGTVQAGPFGKVSIDTAAWLAWKLGEEEGIDDNRNSVNTLLDLPDALHG